METDQDPSERVLRNREMLLTVFENVDLKTLLVCRQVCHKWRSVAMLSLKSRIRTVGGSTFVYRDTGEEFSDESSDEDDSLDVNCAEDQLQLWIRHKPNRNKNRSRSFPKATSVKLTLRCATMMKMKQRFHGFASSRAPARVLCSKRNPSPWFIATALELDWLSSVSKLVLVKCMTVDDWNAAGKGILKKFTSLTKLKLELARYRSAILPFCYTELRNEDPNLCFPSLEKVKVEYAIISKRTEVAVKDRLFWNKLVWTKSIDWDFLRRCSNLEVFKASIGHDIQCSNYFDDGAQAKIEIENFDGHYEMQVRDGNMHLDSYGVRTMRPSPKPWSYAKYNRFLMEDITQLVTVTSTRVLEMTTQLETLLNFKHAEKLEVLSLQQTNIYDGPYVLPTLKQSTGFKNLKRLSWNCVTPCGESADTGFLKGKTLSEPVLPNLVTLTVYRMREFYTINEGGRTRANKEKVFNVLDALMKEEFHMMAPNVEVLVTECFYKSNEDFAKILKLSKFIKKLKHLVVVSYRAFDFFELLEPEIECMQGLESLIFIVRGSNPANSIKVFKDVFKKVPSLKKLEIFAEDVSETGQVMTKRSSSTTNKSCVIRPIEELSGPATFEGVENSYFWWEEVRRNISGRYREKNQELFH